MWPSKTISKLIKSCSWTKKTPTVGLYQRHYLDFSVQSSAVQDSAVQYYAVLCSAVQRTWVQHRGVLLRSVPRAIRERYLLKVTFGANGFYFLHNSILCGGKRAGPPKLLGEYEENTMFSFFCHTLTFKLFRIFNTCGRIFFCLKALIYFF